MKEALAFIGILALAASMWFLRGNSDSTLLISKDEAIQSLQKETQTKEDLLLKNNALVDSGNATIRMLQENLQAKDDIASKDKLLLDSLNARVKTLQDSILEKDDIIAKNNALIASLQQAASKPVQNDPDAGKMQDFPKIYPADNGFEMQDLGSGFFSYKVFGPLKNPNHVQFPKKVPNRTPWKFGNGNSGIAANGSGYYVTGATNLDSDGTTSTSGQVGTLEYAGSSISQTIKLPAGTYTVSFDYEARRDYTPANVVAVSIDETVLFKGAPTDSDHFKQVTTDPITLTSSGVHDLKFAALGSAAAYPCTFIDNVCLNVIKRDEVPTQENSFGIVSPLKRPIVFDKQ